MLHRTMSLKMHLKGLILVRFRITAGYFSVQFSAAVQHRGLIVSEHVEQTTPHDLRCQSPALTSSRSADWRILQDTSRLLYEFQEQLSSTQQEEIFHKFQL